MEEAAQSRVPASYWIIAGLGMLWNVFGAYDYLMTRMRNVEYLRQTGDPQVILAWIDSFPRWVHFLWPLGVWGSVAGSVLMLLRSRQAATAFLVSLVGAVGAFAYQLSATRPAALDTPASKIIPLVIVGIVIFLWWYSRRAAAQGVMR